MKAGLTLTQLAQEIERRANARKDFMAPVAKLQMDAQGELIVGNNIMPANSHAHSQVAEYVGIPKPYYDRMRAEQPKLLADNVNTWFSQKTMDTRMVRTMDGTVDAFLSDRFRALDYYDLGEALLPVLMDMDVIIASSQITDRRMYIKAIDRRIERDVPTGKHMGDSSHTFFDTVSPAIIISNSEVGAGRLSIETGVYTRVCTNLAMIGSNFKKQHVGGKFDMLGEDVQHLLTDDTKRLSDKAVWAQVRDVVKGAFDAVKFEALTQKLTGAAADRIEGDVVEVVNRFAKRNALGEDTGKSILRHLIESADLTRYGLHSAITRASQDVVDYDTATDLERLGGQVIELPKHSWQELQAA